MRKFKTNPFGYEIDLDNTDNYDYLPNHIKQLRDIMFKEIGYSYWYINFRHKGLFDSQKENIEKLIQRYTDDWKEHHNDIVWYKEQIFLLQNEIENMC